jgi:transcriptional regulator with XRE-family HTH domain
MQDCSPEELQSWRARMGWTQSQAAEKLGISLSDYSDRENGRSAITRECMLACQMIEKNGIELDEREKARLTAESGEYTAATLGISVKSLYDEQYAQGLLLTVLFSILAKQDWFRAEDFSKAVSEYGLGIPDGPSYCAVHQSTISRYYDFGSNLARTIENAKKGFVG